MCRHYEYLERIKKIDEAFDEYDVKIRMHMLNSRDVTTEELCLEKSDSRELGENLIFKYAKLTVGSTLEIMDNVLHGEYQNGISVVRSSAHHTEEDHPHEFGIFNNVALATQYALKKHGPKRLILTSTNFE